MPKKTILLFAEASLLVLLCILWSHMCVVSTAQQKPKLPDEPKPTTDEPKLKLPAEQKPKPPDESKPTIDEPKLEFPAEQKGEKPDAALAKVELALAKEKPGTLIVADKDGNIVDTADVKELRREDFKSLADYAHKKAGSDACQKISTKCLRCPNGKIYCSNDAKFATGQKSKN